MTNLLYLVVPLLISVVVGLVVVMKGRRPRSVEAGIEEFSRGLKALQPEDEKRNG
ncbi:MAG: hypothetical protein ACYCS7_06895 [Acidimicrobiales bacterium]